MSKEMISAAPDYLFSANPTRLWPYPDFRIVAQRDKQYPTHQIYLTAYEVTAWFENEDGSYKIADEDTEPYVSGMFKWDACCHIYFNSYLHLCDKENFEKHVRLVTFLYEYARELLLQSPELDPFFYEELDFEIVKKVAE